MTEKKLIVRDATGRIVEMPLSFEVVLVPDEIEARKQMLDQSVRETDVNRTWKQLNQEFNKIQKKSDELMRAPL
jgi:hypothetical protein